MRLDIESSRDRYVAVTQAPTWRQSEGHVTRARAINMTVPSHPSSRGLAVGLWPAAQMIWPAGVPWTGCAGGAIAPARDAEACAAIESGV